MAHARKVSAVILFIIVLLAPVPSAASQFSTDLDVQAQKAEQRLAALDSQINENEKRLEQLSAGRANIAMHLSHRTTQVYETSSVTALASLELRELTTQLQTMNTAVQSQEALLARLKTQHTEVAADRDRLLAELAKQKEKEAPAPAAVCANPSLPSVDGWATGQLANASAIVRAGQELHLPRRAWVIAIATAIQESALRNLSNPSYPDSAKLSNEGEGFDHDSLGLFQQRPSTGWGTVEQVMEPTFAAKSFYTRLQQVAGWENLPLTDAAQSVQISAFPDAYAKHEQTANVIVDAITAAQAAPCPEPAVAAPAWVAPVAGNVGSAFRTDDRPDHNGVDYSAERGAEVHAISDGVVLTARCEASISCDTDGSINVSGCGWYVDLLHADNSVSRYCHLLREPSVAEGETVAKGQAIGLVGSSGNSTGPHLHFETHLDNGQDSSSAVDPVEFLRARGVSAG